MNVRRGLAFLRTFFHRYADQAKYLDVPNVNNTNPWAGVRAKGIIYDGDGAAPVLELPLENEISIQDAVKAEGNEALAAFLELRTDDLDLEP